MDQLKKTDILRYVAQYLPTSPIIVEAGAFDGRDTQRMSKQWPAGVVHAFEPVPAIFAMLATNTQQLLNVVRHPYALGATTGTATLYVSEKPSRPGQPFQAGSLLKPHERLVHSEVRYPSTIIIDTITLDDWAKQNNIDHVDFMWLDVQGFALNILQASPQILTTLRALYVEVEFIQAYENQYQYEDVKAWLEQHNFVMIARDFTDQPSWFYGNALFVSADIQKNS